MRCELMSPMYREVVLEMSKNGKEPTSAYKEMVGILGKKSKSGTTKRGRRSLY
jgi:hypothetical protein|tara:strand:+ start:205 stop:363 length:159 start_codon:yes stop_codon:yes gene_type:complete